MGITLYCDITSLITDRIEADVSRAAYLSGIDYADMTAEEKAEWDSNLKGAYNASDLNRVESAVDCLSGLLRSLPEKLKEYAASLDVAWDAVFSPPYDPAGIDPQIKVGWEKEDIPTPADMERYLANVVLLKNSLEYATAELPPSMVNLTWQGANAIEQALKDLNEAIIVLRNYKESLIDNTAASWFYSGEIYSGEV